MDSAYISEPDNDAMADSESGQCPRSGTTVTVKDVDLDDFSPYSPISNGTSEDRRNITALLEAYGSLSVNRLLDLLAVNFIHRVLPESLGMPPRDKDAFAQHAAGIFSVFESFHMDPVEMLKMQGWHETWVVRANMAGLLKGGKGGWKNECVMIVRMDDEGMLVEEIQEFVDSAKAMEMKRVHAPKDFGTAALQTMTVNGGRPAADYMASFCWFLVCALVSKLGAPVLALIIFWVHPTLEVSRRSFFAATGFGLALDC